MDKEKIIVEEILPHEGRAYTRSVMKQMALDGLINKFIRENLTFQKKDDLEVSNYIGFKVTKEERRGNEFIEGDVFRATLIPMHFKEQHIELKSLAPCRKLTWRERFRALFKGRI